MRTKPDYRYITEKTGDMLGVPIRVYEEGKCVYFSSSLPFPKDPVTLHEAKILSLNKNVGYYIAPDFSFVNGKMVFFQKKPPDGGALLFFLNCREGCSRPFSTFSFFFSLFSLTFSESGCILAPRIDNRAW